MQPALPPPLYDPTAAERARQDFVLGVKLLANGALQSRVRAEYRSRIAPELARELGHDPLAREQVADALARSDAFREWATFTHASQSMMWSAVEPTARRGASMADAELDLLGVAHRPLGSLELDPALESPPPIGGTEIHRQPGGYVAEEVGPAGSSGGRTIAGLRYLGSSLIYSPGKGNAAAATEARGAVIVEQLRRHFPLLEPRRILDLGCGIGVASQTVALAFPEAEFHAIDVAPGLLRLGHLLAERRGVAIHFHQRDAAATRFDAGQFDLVVSNLLFHETSSGHLPAILRECRRLLAPRGAMLHADVATQVTRLGLPDQVMNDWQVRWNGEPFWTEFAQLDMREAIIAAGFAAADAFAEYVPRGGGGATYVFGASR